TVLTDVLPAGVGLIPAIGPAAATCAQAAGVVTCDLGTVADGASDLVTIVVTPTTATGRITNTATATTAAGDTNPGNNTDSVDTMIAPTPTTATDLALDKDAMPGMVAHGQLLTYPRTVPIPCTTLFRATVLTDVLPA